MILYILLFIIICLFLWDFKKGILIIAPLKFLILPSVIIGGLQFNSVVTFIAFLFFLFKNKKNYNKDSFPVFFTFLLMAISQVNGAFAGGIHLKALFNYLFSTLLFIYILYNNIENKKDISILLKSILICLILILFNATIEFFSSQRINILSDFMIENSAESAYFSADNNIDGRGMRIRSQFSHSIVFGDICAIFLYLLLFLYINIKNRIFYVIIAVYCSLGIILSLSRTPILGMLFFIVPVLFNKSVFTKHGTIIIIICIIGFSYISNYVYSILDSILNQNSQMDFGGSSLELRMQQLEGCLLVIAKNPFWGLGVEFNLEDWSWLLLGNESTWFELLCRQGIIGCLINLFIYIQIIIKSRRNYFFNYIIFLSLGWFIISTASNLSNMDSFPFYLVYIIIYKYGLFIKRDKKLKLEKYDTFNYNTCF